MIRLARRSRRLSTSFSIRISQCCAGAFLTLLCLHSHSLANGVDVDGFLSEFESRRGEVSTFSARFVQKRTLQLFDEVKVSTGTILYKAPRRMIWKYVEPDKTQMRILPDSVEYYFPELEQIEVYPTEKDGGASHFFFAFESSGEQLKKRFDVSIGRAGERLTRVDLLPRTESTASQLLGLTLWLDDADYLPRRIVVREISGDTTEIELSEIRVNETVGDGELEFDAPEGTQIIKNDSSGL